ncbi:hypothetical protein TWF481_007072 [Arthrobotrys musiformis]|uniref:Uncharacterized protein n=1 Tax=Arthrobotrys musiformis TaxID=47236 RepID=A0AAV9WCA0_9PEZI
MDQKRAAKGVVPSNHINPSIGSACRTIMQVLPKNGRFTFSTTFSGRWGRNGPQEQQWEPKFLLCFYAFLGLSLFILSHPFFGFSGIDGLWICFWGRGWWSVETANRRQLRFDGNVVFFFFGFIPAGLGAWRRRLTNWSEYSDTRKNKGWEERDPIIITLLSAIRESTTGLVGWLAVGIKIQHQ